MTLTWAHRCYFTGYLLTCLASTSHKSQCIHDQSFNVHMIKSEQISSVNTLSSVCVSLSFKHTQTLPGGHIESFLSLFARPTGTHTYTYLPLPSVGRGHLFSFTSPSSLPFFGAVTSLFSACLHSSPLLKSLSLFSPQSAHLLLFTSCTLHLFPSFLVFFDSVSFYPTAWLWGSSLVGGSLVTDSHVNKPFICPYCLRLFIYTSAVNTCCILPFMQFRIQSTTPHEAIHFPLPS